MKTRKRVNPPRRGFRVDNRTKWSTADLRRLVGAVVKRQGGPPRGFVVEVRTGNYSGYAWINGSRMIVRVPALWRFAGGALPASHHIASITAHELAHLRGLRGERDMRGSKWLGHERAQEAYAWAADYPVRPAERAVKVRAVGSAADEKKCQAAAGKVLAWERRAKLAATKLKVWRGKVRYYERKMAARKAAEVAPCAQ